MNGLATSTMIARRVGDVLLFVHGTEAPSDAEWDQAMQLYSAIGPASAKSLIWTEGAAPNAAQRAKLAKINGTATPPMAVLTDSMVARAAGTAISWFNPGFKIFPPTAVDRALDHLELPASERAPLVRALDQAKAELREMLTPPGRGRTAR